jgi:hypothetical protein
MTFNQLQLRSKNLLMGLPTKNYYPVDYPIEFTENESGIINQKEDQVSGIDCNKINISLPGPNVINVEN